MDLELVNLVLIQRDIYRENEAIRMEAGSRTYKKIVTQRKTT